MLAPSRCRSATPDPPPRRRSSWPSVTGPHPCASCAPHGAQRRRGGGRPALPAEAPAVRPALLTIRSKRQVWPVVLLELAGCSPARRRARPAARSSYEADADPEPRRASTRHRVTLDPRPDGSAPLASGGVVASGKRVPSRRAGVERRRRRTRTAGELRPRRRTDTCTTSLAGRTPVHRTPRPEPAAPGPSKSKRQLASAGLADRRAPRSCSPPTWSRNVMPSTV